MNYLDMFLLEISDEAKRNIKYSGVGAAVGAAVGARAKIAEIMIVKRREMKMCNAIEDENKRNECIAMVNKRFSKGRIAAGIALTGTLGAGTGALIAHGTKKRRQRGGMTGEI